MSLEDNTAQQLEALRQNVPVKGVTKEQSDKISNDYKDRMTKESESLQKEFEEQLRAFAADDSYFSQYEKFTPFTKSVLVKLFKFVPASEYEGLGRSMLMIESPIDGKIKPQFSALHEKVYPIVKVIKKGLLVESNKIEEGKLYTVPNSDVVGDDFNPDFLFLMNTMVQQGQKGGLARVPENMRQRIPKLEKNWDKYKFGMPTRVGDLTDDDHLIYLLPEPKLEAIFEL